MQPGSPITAAIIMPSRQRPRGGSVQDTRDLIVGIGEAVMVLIYGPRSAKSNRLVRRRRGLRIAPNTRLRPAPMATVRPIPRSTGIEENDRIPKPITVQRSASTSEAIIRV